ncbi:MAG: UDP-2,3-diacylglucosamine diphosphatase LpxI [Thermodesulforhabdaceae bacterium]
MGKEPFADTFMKQNCESLNYYVGLIAGGGQFPILFSKAAREKGFSVVAIGIEGETSEELSRYVDQFHWVKLGEVGKIISILKESGVHRLALAGHIDKRRIYSRIKLDWRGARLAMKLLTKHDDEVLRAFAEELEKEGITVEPSTIFLNHLLAPEGVLSHRTPGHRECKDIAFGWKMAKTIGSLDIGQCVVVKHQTVLAVEAIDGTDATIIRGGELCDKGAVVVKTSKPGQDLRFDVPATGLSTIEAMKKVGASVLAVEAGKTLMFDLDAMIEEADRAGIAIVGIKGPETLENLRAARKTTIKNLIAKVTTLGTKSEKTNSEASMKNIRIAVVGTGYLGQFHVEKLLKLPHVDFKGVVDTNENRAKFIAERFKVPYFSSHREILNQVEAVIVATPTVSHFDIGRDFIEAGVHVFIEKPMTLNLDEADQLIELAEKRGCIIQVGHIERFNPAFRTLKAQIESPSFIHARRLSQFKERGTDVDVVMDLMIHDLDLLFALVPHQISELWAVGKSIVTNFSDTAFARIVFSNGVVAYLEASRVFSQDIRRMDIVDNGRCLVADYKNREVYEVPLKPYENQGNSNILRFLDVEPGDALLEELQSFVESIRSGSKPLVDGQTARKALAVAMEISKFIAKSSADYKQ